jgi:putative thiamine transport system substrate-binding protein
MTVSLNRRSMLAQTSAAALGIAAPWAQATQSLTWSGIEKAARGQTVSFNAWGGSERINSYIAWAAAELKRDFDITLEHVKLAETSDAIKRVRNEKAAGRNDGGSVGLIWINGENFLTMKREGLLFGPFAETLPNFRYVDVQGKPTTRIDFAEPVQGLEAPWGMAQLTFFADRAKVPVAPRSTAALLEFARKNPGRVSYPKLPDFHGTTFVKQALLDVTADKAALYKPYDPAAFATVTAPLWKHLDALHPHLWREGKQFAKSASAVRQMMADGDLLLGLTFNPNEAANEIADKRLPASVYSYQFDSGTIGNTHFVAIPFNASSTAASQVAANFLLSPGAQARKAHIAIWGDPTVLAPSKLPALDAARFASGAAPGQVERAAPTLPEPHGSWVDPIEKEWLRRYGA